MTNETKKLIEEAMNKLSQAMESVELGLLENMSPNDIEFYEELEQNRAEAQDLIHESLEQIFE